MGHRHRSRSPRRRRGRSPSSPGRQARRARRSRADGLAGRAGPRRAWSPATPGERSKHGHSVARHYGPHGEAGRTDITVFIEVFAPPPRMLIFGAVDFTAALVRVAKVLGYHVTVCDARPVFATSARFPEADEVVADWPHRYLAKVADRLGPGTPSACSPTTTSSISPRSSARWRPRSATSAPWARASTHKGRVERLRAEGVGPDDIATDHGSHRHRHRRPDAGGDRRLHLRRDHLAARRGQGRLAPRWRRSDPPGPAHDRRVPT